MRLAGVSALLTFVILCAFAVAIGSLTVHRIRADFNNQVNEDKWYQSALAVEGKVADFDVLYSGGWFERSVHNLVDYSNYTVGYDAKSQFAGATYTATRYLDCTSGTPVNNCNGAGGTVTETYDVCIIASATMT